MIDKLLLLVPSDLTPPTWLLAGGFAVGAILWAVGSRLSRSLFTLGFVAIGCYVGRRLPIWFDFHFSPVACAIAAAIVGGIIGYSMHRWWAGLVLGYLLAIWGALALWVLYGPATWTWPVLESWHDLPSYLRDLWFNLPAEIAHPLPIVCGSCLVAGTALTMLWPRIGVALLHSLLGSTLLASSALLLAHTRYPDALAKVPQHQWAQVAILGTLVLLGMGLQWKLRSRPKPKPAAPAPPPED